MRMIKLKEGKTDKNTCNNDKNLSEIQLEHEREDELVVVVHELDALGGGEIRLEEESWRKWRCWSHFGKKFGWWFKQDIDGENEDDNEIVGDGDEKGCWVK
ncbi:hypothetical protein Tco_0840794 [Tanacetum coccineum]|uniref:Uncharacterized protein n=1 Tax=Tanacetum coccineum TaxID=301880 RepID=A0ABQ5AX05_9ASTR